MKIGGKSAVSSQPSAISFSDLHAGRESDPLAGWQAIKLSSYQAIPTYVMDLATAIPRRKAPREAL